MITDFSSGEETLTSKVYKWIQTIFTIQIHQAFYQAFWSLSINSIFNSSTHLQDPKAWQLQVFQLQKKHALNLQGCFEQQQYSCLPGPACKRKECNLVLEGNTWAVMFIYFWIWDRFSRERLLLQRKWALHFNFSGPSQTFLSEKEWFRFQEIGFYHKGKAEEWKLPVFYIEKSLVEIRIPCHSKTLCLDILQLTRRASPLLPFVDRKSKWWATFWGEGGSKWWDRKTTSYDGLVLL